MKRLLIMTITTLTAMGIASPLLAQTTITTNTGMAREILEITPYDLVTGSYQGRFANQGIPSAGRFTTAVRTNKIQAEDLVEAAIAQRRLSAETLNDRSYISHVEAILNNLDRN